MRSVLTVSALALAALLGVAPVAAIGPGAALALPQSAVVDRDRVARLTGAMRLADLLAVVRDEGLAYGAALDRDLLGGTGGAGWREDVARIYDPAAARDVLETALLAAVRDDPAVMAGLETFYDAPLGQKVAALEVAARRELLDPSAHDRARAAWAAEDGAESRRARQLKTLVDSQGLVELNVQGTLNANLALYRGLAEGGGLAPPLDEDEVLAQVAGQEPQIRAAAEDWLLPYLTLAYRPLTDDEMDDYLAFLATPEGGRANLAMAKAFDALFSRFSHDLGLAAARRLTGHAI